jgi:hypothetical protein
LLWRHYPTRLIRLLAWLILSHVTNMYKLLRFDVLSLCFCRWSAAQPPGRGTGVVVVNLIWWCSFTSTLLKRQPFEYLLYLEPVSCQLCDCCNRWRLWINMITACWNWRSVRDIPVQSIIFYFKEFYFRGGDIDCTPQPIKLLPYSTIPSLQSHPSLPMLFALTVAQHYRLQSGIGRIVTDLLDESLLDESLLDELYVSGGIDMHDYRTRLGLKNIRNL